jgi:hypothetical protein
LRGAGVASRERQTEHSRCVGGTKTGKAEPLRAPPPCAMSSLTPVRDDRSDRETLRSPDHALGLMVAHHAAACPGLGPYLASRCYDGAPTLAGLAPRVRRTRLRRKRPYRLHQTAFGDADRPWPFAPADPSAFKPPMAMDDSGLALPREFSACFTRLPISLPARSTIGPLTRKSIHELGRGGGATRELIPTIHRVSASQRLPPPAPGNAGAAPRCKGAAGTHR